MILQRLLCKHQFTIIKEKETNVYSDNSMKYNMISDITYTIVQHCSKCGKIKKKTVKL